jgi:hypothetical protein
MNKNIPLPKPLIDIDVAPNNFDRRTKYASEPYDQPHYTQFGGVIEFEIWYTERFGWCIPTLGISGISRRGRAAGITTARTYAIAIKDGGQVRVGHGPHVLATHRVLVRESRLEALKPLLDLMIQGQASAGDTRDRISTRRANSRRSGYNSTLRDLGLL